MVGGFGHCPNRGDRGSRGFGSAGDRGRRRSPPTSAGSSRSSRESRKALWELKPSRGCYGLGGGAGAWADSAVWPGGGAFGGPGPAPPPPPCGPPGLRSGCASQWPWPWPSSAPCLWGGPRPGPPSMSAAGPCGCPRVTGRPSAWRANSASSTWGRWVGPQRTGGRGTGLDHPGARRREGYQEPPPPAPRLDQL